jgi:hypothetical protein
MIVAVGARESYLREEEVDISDQSTISWFHCALKMEAVGFYQATQ